MLNIIIGGMRCRLSLLFPAVLLFLLYFDPSGIVLFGFLASFIHEGGHLLACYCMNRPPQELIISLFGMRMVTAGSCEHSDPVDVTIALAGPFVNALAYILLCALNTPPLYGGIHLVLAILNLLPVYPLDGGRVLRVWLEHSCQLPFAKQLEDVVFWVTVIVLFHLGGLLLGQESPNPTLLFVTCYLIFMRLFYNRN